MTECCGNPSFCERPCFHDSGRTTTGRAGAIAGTGINEPARATTLNSAHDFLGMARSTMDERGQQYDKSGQERSMGRVVKAFNAVTGHDISEADGWTLMTLLKLVRDQKELPHLDSLVDAVAYAALRAECRAKEAE